MNSMLDGHLKETLHGLLNCNCKGNCLLKSLHVTEIYRDTAIVDVEPFDDAFNQNQIEETIDKIKRTLLRRKKAIHKVLGVEELTVTVYDEWTMKDAFVVNFTSHSIQQS